MHTGFYDFVLGVDFLSDFVARETSGDEARGRIGQLFTDVKRLLKPDGS